MPLLNSKLKIYNYKSRSPHKYTYLCIYTYKQTQRTHMVHAFRRLPKHNTPPAYASIRLRKYKLCKPQFTFGLNHTLRAREHFARPTVQHRQYVDCHIYVVAFIVLHSTAFSLVARVREAHARAYASAITLTPQTPFPPSSSRVWTGSVVLFGVLAKLCRQTQQRAASSSISKCVQ